MFFLAVSVFGHLGALNQKYIHRNVCSRKRKIVAAMKMTGENRAEGSEITMDDVNNLIKKKDEIEEQIKAYHDVLEDVSWTPTPQSYPGLCGDERVSPVLYSKVSELRVPWLTLKATPEQILICTPSGTPGTIFHVSNCLLLRF